MTRTVSGNGLSQIGLGCSRIGSFNNPVPVRDIRNLLAQALDLGVNVFDTADIYGQGDSEREIGRALAGCRDDAFVVTKVGKTFSAKMRLLRPLKPLVKPLLAAAGRAANVGSPGSVRSAGNAVTARRGAYLAGNFDPRHLERAVDASLRRLGMESVDGLLLHSPPASVVRDPAVQQWLDGLRRSGRVRHYGVSCDDADALEAALALDGLDLLQVPLDLLDAAAQGEIAQRLSARGIVVFAREVIRLSPGISAAAAVAGACRRPEVTTAIVGTSRLEHLREIVAAVSASGSLAAAGSDPLRTSSGASASFHAGAS